MKTHWIIPYLRLPYKEGGRDHAGVDCWGLIRLIYRDLLGIDLPAFPGIAGASAIHLCGEIEKESNSSHWKEIEWPEDKCVVAMSQLQAIHHVGVYAEADGGKVIHAWQKQGIIADTFFRIRLKGFRTIKFYRHGLYHSHA